MILTSDVLARALAVERQRGLIQAAERQRARGRRADARVTRAAGALARRGTATKPARATGV